MKKILMFLLALIIIFSVKEVYAQDQYKLTLEKQSGIFFLRKKANSPDDSQQFYVYKMDGIFAYCIEPGVRVTTTTYVENDNIDLGFSDELKEKLELIGYYGRGYKNHDSVRYSLATQALIWEQVGIDSVTFWTKINGEGEEIDVSPERNEIMRLVNNHKTLPSFNTHYYGNLKHEMVIDDVNNVLDDYEIIDNGSQEAYIDNNKLHIIPRHVGIYEFALRKKNYHEYKTIFFVGQGNASTQKVARFNFSKEIRTSFTICIDGISLLVHKVDENNNPIPIHAMQFKVYDLTRDKEVCSGLPNCIHTTSEDGYFITEPLDYGEYVIEEVEDQIIPGYTWNKDKLYVTIDDETRFNYNEEYYNYYDVYFTNKSVIGSIEINKKGEEVEFTDNNILYKENNLSNITFDLYNSDNNLINEVTTNDYGYAKIDNLPLGNYYLIEKTKIDKYQDIGKIDVSLKQDNQYQEKVNVNLVVKNEIKKGKLEFSKLDMDTSIGIPNTIIEIYSSDNSLLLTKKTDEYGKIIVDNLPYGKYYLKEKQANDNYELTNEIIEFEIKKDDEIVKKTLTNKRILGTIEIRKYGEKAKFVNNEIIYEKEILPEIEFSIYDINDNLITSIKTNEFGYAYYSKLPLGRYYYVENSSLDEYITNNEKHYFKIEKEGNEALNVSVEVINYLKKGVLDFTKEDIVNGDKIPDTIIEIYGDSNNLLLTKKTDEFGKVMIDNLPVGKYYITEKTANSLYLLTNKKIYFEIKENNELVETKMFNERIKIPVPRTRTNESIIVHSLFGIIFLIGMERMYYEKKESY